MPNIQDGTLDFTIYQDPYLQGFLPVLYMYLYNLSGGVLSPPDTDTGLSVVTKANVGPLRGRQPVPGQHDRGEVPAAGRRCDPLPDGHDQHLTDRTIRGRGESTSLAPAVRHERGSVEQARPTENEGECS